MPNQVQHDGNETICFYLVVQKVIQKMQGYRENEYSIEPKDRSRLHHLLAARVSPALPKLRYQDDCATHNLTKKT